jgi:hypothetical protein
VGAVARVNFSFRAAQAFPCAFIQSCARRRTRTPLAVATEKHNPRILLPSAVHQFTEVFIPGDKDRSLTVRSREHALPCQRRIGTPYLVVGLAAREFLENQLDGDAGSFNYGLAEHHVWIGHDPRSAHGTLLRPEDSTAYEAWGNFWRIYAMGTHRKYDFPEWSAGCLLVCRYVCMIFSKAERWKAYGGMS